METVEADCIVIGAGVVGLACATELARRGCDVLVLEAADSIGTGISSRNSEVVHAGIYYPTGSLKHRLCVNGRRRLYAYLAARHVAHHKCGKLIVACDSAEQTKIETLYKTACANDVENMALISSKAAKALEPSVRCVGALVSPETGIVDSHGLMLALLGELQDSGGAVALSTSVRSGRVLDKGGVELDTGAASPVRVRCRLLVNAAGLYAQKIAQRIEGAGGERVPPLKLAKGSYFSCRHKSPFSRLIYPAPADGGLGVHLTLDLSGRMRFGPDVEWLDTSEPDQVDYHVDATRSEAFYAAIRRYWPGLSEGALAPDYSGCRPKLSGRGEPFADFRIDGPEAHGVEGLVHLFGIESPGLTSALAIAQDVADRLAHRDRDDALHVEVGR